METNNYTQPQINAPEEEDESFIDLSKILFLITLHWPWFVISVIACLVGAFVYLRFQTPIYSMSGSVLIKDDGSRSRNSAVSTMNDMLDVGYVATTRSFDNELEILKTLTLVKKAVTDLDLYVSSYYKQAFGYMIPVYKTTPINVVVPPSVAENIPGTIELDMVYKPNGTLNVEAKYGEFVKKAKYTKFPSTMILPAATIVLTKNDSVPAPKNEVHMVTYISSPSGVAASYKGRLNVSPLSETTSIAVLSVVDPCPQRGIDFINCLVNDYNQDANDVKNAVAQRTADFIDQRIEIINAELSGTESKLASYKQQSGLVSGAGEASIALSQKANMDAQTVENNTQVTLIKALKEYVNNPTNAKEVIPANIGLSNSAVSGSVGEYNKLILERKRLLQTSNEANPVVQRIDEQLANLHSTINAGLDNTLSSIKITQSSINAQAGTFQSRITNAPIQEKQIITIGRQQEIKSDLYMMLLQKREENVITLAATANNGRIIETPKVTGYVGPDSRRIYLIALGIGLAIPFLIIWIIQSLKYKIENRDDIKKITNVPVVGELPLSDTSEGAIVVRENRNELNEEAFRGLRTNLLFMLKPGQKVIQFTSTQPSEGKSYIAGNIAVSLAFLGKKVLIMGMDIRKPGLNKIFNISKSLDGISNYLSNPEEYPLSKITQHSDINSNLDIIPGGVIPPNPTELVSRDVLDKVMVELREKYDYIIIDSAPIAMVTDSDIISRVADICVYVCRADVTPKAALDYVNKLKYEKKFDQFCIAINGIDLSKRKHTYKYGYGYGYGKNYGYGYGYGYGYNKPGKKRHKKSKKSSEPEDK